jgi:rSAM/selenodomain-associated transferase 2/rSAM/selenodomain-associated transferase 1
MTEHTLSIARVLEKNHPGSLEVHFTGGNESEMGAWLGADLKYVKQGPGDLGDRLQHALKLGFSQGCRRSLVIGTDCPGLSVAHLQAAFDALRKCDAVFGPSLDGGYYLIGLRRMDSRLFQDIPWGGDRVLKKSLAKAHAAGLRVKTLNPLQDVDTPDDLDTWDRCEQQTLSIVIPALNEQDLIRETLLHTAGVEPGERIVVDGGSFDRTVERAEAQGARVVLSSPGRGPQMNLGAENASGSILLFLHADTLLPPDFSGLIRSQLNDPAVIGGYFRLRFIPRTFQMRFKEWTVNLRTRIFRLPYGDQAYFVRASVFHLAQGFPDIPLMEDVDFIRKLRRLGKLVYIPTPVSTSARRFLRYSGFLGTVRNKLTFYGYRIGVPPERLARWYYRGSAQNPEAKLEDVKKFKSDQKNA